MTPSIDVATFLIICLHRAPLDPLYHGLLPFPFSNHRLPLMKNEIRYFTAHKRRSLFISGKFFIFQIFIKLRPTF
jgi:hypothetical protein